MAGKMANFIAYQKRHLSADDFQQWIASDVKVQAFLDRQNRIPAVVRALDEYQNQIFKKVMAPALEKASAYLATLEKSGAAATSDSGTLAQSIGSTKAKFYASAFCGYIASGPRRGYARIVQIQTDATGQSQRKRMSKKFTMATPSTMPLKNPTAYAKFLIHGRKAIVARGQRGAIALISQGGGGSFFRHGVKAAAPRDFMQSANTSTQGAANIAACDMQISLQKLTTEN